MEESKEINNNKNNKKLFLTIIGVLALIVAAVGVTYAAWSYTFNGTSINTLSTADISLELLESDDNVINITDALPMSDAEGKAQQQVFDFVVTSKTVRDIDVDYTVSMEKLSADTGYTLLNDNQIKLYLTDGSGSPIWTEATNNVKKVSDLSTYVLTTGQHSHDSTHNKVQDKYKLRVWIDSSVDASSWNASTKYQYKFRIGVTGGEHVSGQSGGNNNESLEVISGYACDEPINVTVAQYVYSMSSSSTNEVQIGDSMNSISGKTSDYTTLNSNFLLRHVIDENDKVVRNDTCFIKDNTLYCLKGSLNNCANASNDESPYFETNSDTLLLAFGADAVENDICTIDEGPEGNASYCEDDSYSVIDGLMGQSARPADAWIPLCGVDAAGKAGCA